MHKKKRDITLGDLNRLQSKLVNDALRGGKIANIALVAEVAGEDYSHPFDRQVEKTVYKRVRHDNTTIMYQRLRDWGRVKKYRLVVDVGGITVVSAVITGSSSEPGAKYLPGEWERWIYKKAEKIKAAVKLKEDVEKKATLDEAWGNLRVDDLPATALNILDDIVDARKDLESVDVNLQAVVKKCRLFLPSSLGERFEIDPRDHGVRTGDKILVTRKKKLQPLGGPKIDIVIVEFYNDQRQHRQAGMYLDDIEIIEETK